MNTLQQRMDQQQTPLNVIYVSSYIPRKCGIATYTKDLTNAINLLNARSLAEILTVTPPEHEYDYPWESKLKIGTQDLVSYISAADYVNQSHADVVHLQHEFGLYGGEAGEYILRFAEALKVPLVTTFHTVLLKPSEKQRKVIQDLGSASRAIIVMMEQASKTLEEVYGIDQQKIIVIPHGVPDVAFTSSNLAKRKRKLSDRIVIGNINLLAPNKGIEYALEATAIIAKTYPTILYTLIGQTHPDLVQHEGERYRNLLKKRVRELGIAQHVRFVNEYLPLPELIHWLETIDIYITAYLDPEQVTSGALAYAIGVGKACISTPYIYSKEVLANNRGVLVPFRNAKAIADAVIDLLEHPKKANEIARNAYAFGRLMTWPNVANSHLDLFRTVLAASADIYSNTPQPFGVPQNFSPRALDNPVA